MYIQGVWVSKTNRDYGINNVLYYLSGSISHVSDVSKKLSYSGHYNRFSEVQKGASKSN